MRNSSGSERAVRRGSRVLALVVCAFLVPSAFVAMAQPAHASDASSIASMTNKERAKRGLAGYSSNSQLRSIAQSWSNQMAKSGKLAHNPRLASQVTGYKFVGENVGYGPSAEKIHAALMNSTAHRNNILDRDFSQIGVGSARDSKGRLWITQVFRDPAGGGAATKPKPKPKATPKPKPSAKPKATTKPKPKPSAKPTVGTVTNSGGASAPVAAPAPKAAPKPKAAPVPTFAQRLSEANEWAEAAGQQDALVSTMSFDRAMRSLAG